LLRNYAAPTGGGSASAPEFDGDRLVHDRERERRSNAVEPSMSVKRNVRVNTIKPRTTARQPQPTFGARQRLEAERTAAMAPRCPGNRAPDPANLSGLAFQVGSRRAHSYSAIRRCDATLIRLRSGRGPLRLALGDGDRLAAATAKRHLSCGPRS
jgi:hypothetical protein